MKSQNCEEGSYFLLLYHLRKQRTNACYKRKEVQGTHAIVAIEGASKRQASGIHAGLKSQEARPIVSVVSRALRSCQEDWWIMTGVKKEWKRTKIQLSKQVKASMLKQDTIDKEPVFAVHSPINDRLSEAVYYRKYWLCE